ncbi:hypothetical protein PybrP1_001701 [[Pythium] brassicae (nom. inval.)]|nr:hypothetical protein PybrP1_001701 [[Pythium] brassicae (nom. inval.)]
MKAPSSLICVAAFAALSSALMVLVDARPMHADIEPHYQRYLQVKDAIQSELDEWMAEFKDQAEENGLIPATEARSAEDTDEDLRQRFFLTKEKIKTLEKQNPDATFSTKSPFTLLTNEEFHAYVHEAYRKVGSGRRLRGGNSWDEPEEASFEDRAKDSNDSNDDDACHSRTDSDDDSSSCEASYPCSDSIDDSSSCEAGYPCSDSNDDSSSCEAGYPCSDSIDDSSSCEAGYPCSDSNDDTGPREAGYPGPDHPKHPCSGRDLPCSSDERADRNQGQCGSCWAFAAVGAVEAGQCIVAGKKSMTKYSEQQLVSCDTKNGACKGGAPPYAFNYVQTNGLCTESAYPYSSAKGAPAVAAGNDVWKQYAGGLIKTCGSTKLDHAVLAVGYDADSIKIKNSWGERWGEAGYMRLQRATGTGTRLYS